MMKRIVCAIIALLLATTVAVPVATADTVDATSASAVTFAYGEPSGPWYRDVRIGSATASDNAGIANGQVLINVPHMMVPSVTVTAHGLDSGVAYCVNLNQLSDPRMYFSDEYNGACATADQSGAASFTVRLVAGSTDWDTLDEYVHDGVVRLYAHLTRKDKIVNGIAAPVSSDTTGVTVQVASVSDTAKLIDPHLSVRNGTVTMQYGYRVDSSLADAIDKACVVADAFRMTDLTVTNSSNAEYLYLSTVDPFTNETAYCGGTDDATLSNGSDAGRTATVTTDSGDGTVTSVQPRTNDRLPVADYRYRRMWITAHPSLIADGARHAETETVHADDTGAIANVHGTTVEDAVNALIRANRTTANAPLASVRASLQLRFRDGSYAVMPFTTATTDTTDDADAGNDPSGQSVSFADVNASTPHVKDIQWLAGSGVTTGWKESDGTVTFRGTNAVTRQDMAAFLYRLAGYPAFDTINANNPFSDVTTETPHYKEILWLASTGIAAGWVELDGSKTFRGMSSVKRQDMAAFLHRLADYEYARPTLGGGVTFRDVTSTTSHSSDIEWLTRTGVATGWQEQDGTHTFRGMHAVKRQDMAAFLHRLSINVL